jgi:hypothetical protein
MIHDRYINEAINIRETYLEYVKELVSKEEKLKTYKDEMEQIMEQNTIYVENNKDKSLDVIKKELQNSLIVVDVKINKINSELKPILDKMTGLQKKSSDLFISIKEKYPNLSEKEIQETIFKKIKR